MSVIIKGMQLPKKGVYFAVISFDGDSLSIRIPPSKKPFFDGRIEEVRTPHGRLIDADDLLRQPMNTANYPKNYVHVAPTIIEAEVSE